MGREALDQGELSAAVVRPGGLWSAVVCRGVTGSTNADAAAAADAGAAEGLVVVAERQSAGRGRLGRVWESPAGAGLMVSVLLRPGVPAARLGWLPLLAGVALASAVGRLSGLPAGLKWPNDLLVRDRKCAGILAEGGAGGMVVVGLGLNVTLRADELPRADATSLALEGANMLDRQALLVGILDDLAEWYLRWRAAGGDPEASGLRRAYREMCVTLGRTVTVSLPGDRRVTGVATGVDGDGRLVVEGQAVAAGDVVHVR